MEGKQLGDVEIGSHCSNRGPYLIHRPLSLGHCEMRHHHRRKSTRNVVLSGVLNCTVYINTSHVRHTVRLSEKSPLFTFEDDGGLMVAVTGVNFSIQD